MPAIVLATLNAKWIHASFGLRCLRANLAELREECEILEFEISQRPVDIAEVLLASATRILGLSVYVWNASQTLQLARILKALRPDLILVLGGPEISYETAEQPLAALADHVVCGEADLAFRDLCRALLRGERNLPHTIQAQLPHFGELADPYDEYTERDIAHRIVYVESSRGCPFTCEFCLSALDIPVRKTDTGQFLSQMQRLFDRGLRHFKFVDRTFNLGIATSTAILEFFRARAVPGLFLHFELIPDRLPEALRSVIAAFPPGMLQFEVGVQTLDPATSERISRRQDVPLLLANLRWLRDHSGAHVHADLIVGLPGEDEPSFARGFDQLWAAGPHEIQVGILKRLRGTPIVRHDAGFAMVYASEPPYEVLQTGAIDFASMQRMKRFARYWDLVANSGNWAAILPLVLAGPSAYGAFAAFAEWLHATTKATAGIALHRLASLLWQWLVEQRGCDAAEVGRLLAADYERCARHDWPEFLRPFVQPERLRRSKPAGAAIEGGTKAAAGEHNPAAKRQARHLGTRERGAREA